ncbi:hypothetical protein [Ottowia testudinis]|uniref:DUF2782 domain-containing protein n=1 Tax=Ottowia testudinis TaxID=2816950 RepID=A0A975CM56_9BURK|nr:hypothetical protein [Ottowia testudinis]QTD46724.1 hypothetical protein J1M35_07590 [Ottowia testudinis]
MRSPSVIKSSLAAVCLTSGALALAQTPPATAPGTLRDEPVLDRKTQRVEHIHTEDAGSRVDEVRSGGETKSIKVQPKAAVPAYDVLPADATGSGANSREAGPGAAGRRVWKLPF